MTGTQYILAGVIILVVSTAGFIIAQVLLVRKKRQIREKVYQIYD